MFVRKNTGSFYIYTLGCKTNQSESDSIAGELLKRGLKPRSPGESPDIIIINTCTVTSAADRKARQAIRRLKKEHPSSIFIVTGCFTVFNKEFLKKNGVEHIVDNKMKSRIAGISGAQDSSEANFPAYGHSRALIKIQDGCEQKCSYCIVPVVRGKYQSRPHLEIINEAIKLEEDGHDEIVLTGIHIGKYGIDIKKNTGRIVSLEGLVSGILEKTSIKRIRLSSLEVNELTMDIVGLLNSSKSRLAHHLHIPLQSGSDEILKKMKRPYSSGYFLKRIEMLKKAIPDIVLSTDVIVGFPGETEKDFSKTLEIVKEVSFRKTHVFKFSPRENTPAFLMGDRIDEKEISSRSGRMRKLGEELRKEFINSLADRFLYPVCEEYDRRNKMVYGMSEQYVRVYTGLEYDFFIKKRGRIIKVLAKAPYLDGVCASISDDN